MKTIMTACVVALATTCSSAQATIFEEQNGYVCSVANTPQLAGPSGVGALFFTLSTQPRCRGDHLPINYACAPDALTGSFTNDYCNAQVRYNAISQALLHEELMRAMESDLPVAVSREKCVHDRNDRGCFLEISVWNARPLEKSARPSVGVPETSRLPQRER